MNLKFAIKSVLRLFGFEIRRIRKNNAQRFIIEDPIHYNSLSNLDKLFSDKNVVNKYLTPERLAFYSDVIKLSKKKGVAFNEKTIADVGCGTGHLLLKILETSNPRKVVGLEYSKEAMKIAKEFCPQAIFHQYNLHEKYPHTFDLVFCLEVLEHLEYPDKALLNLIEMLNYKGVAVISVPNGRKDIFPGHINYWSPESWRIFIQSHIKHCRILFDSLNDNRFNIAIINKN